MALAEPGQQAANAGVPPAFWQEMKSRAKRDIGKLVDIVAPVYAAHFSPAELQQLIQFYRYPLGQRFRTEQQAVSGEITQAAQRWGVELAADVMKEMAAKGIFPN